MYKYGNPGQQTKIRWFTHTRTRSVHVETRVTEKKRSYKKIRNTTINTVVLYLVHMYVPGYDRFRNTGQKWNEDTNKQPYRVNRHWKHGSKIQAYGESWERRTCISHKKQPHNEHSSSTAATPVLQQYHSTAVRFYGKAPVQHSSTATQQRRTAQHDATLQQHSSKTQFYGTVLQQYSSKYQPNTNNTTVEQRTAQHTTAHTHICTHSSKLHSTDRDTAGTRTSR